jgi:hypothetical protein
VFVLELMIVMLTAKEETVLEMQFQVYVNVKKLLELINYVIRLAESRHHNHQFLKLAVN